MGLKLTISLIFVLFCYPAQAQTVRVTSPSQHPYRHMPNELNTIDTAADEECYTYEGDTAQGEWQTCGAGGGGDSITVNSSAATDPDFANGDIDWTLTGGNSITATVGCTDCVALGTETSGNYAAGDAEAGGATDITNGSTDATLSSAGKMHLNTTDEQLSFHSAADGEISGEASISLIRHLTATFDPAGWYDQESTYRVVPLMHIGDDAPEGITITEWKMDYVGGNPTTELDADLMCDTTADYNPAAGATVMDVLDTTTGSSSADTGFDSATCANGSKMYIRFGADPTDANVVVAFDVWFYNEED